jgi:hypothetical protein
MRFVWMRRRTKMLGRLRRGWIPPISLPSFAATYYILDSAGDNNDEGGINSSFPLNDDEDCRCLPAAPAMPSSWACGGSEKRKAGDRANPRRSRAFSQPLKTPRKLLSGNSNDSNDNDSFSFGQMMSYIVYQNRAESEQRDCWNRIDAEHREHEYELPWEE